MDAVFLALRRVFPTVLRMSLSAGVLALVVLALRFALGRAPKWVRCLLWALVAVRLLCPVLPSSRVSLMPREELQTGVVDTVLPTVELQTPSDHAINQNNAGANVPVSHTAQPRQYLPLLWAAGAAVMLLYAAASYLRLRRRVRVSVPLDERVLLCDEIDTPFILGVLRPRIYLPSGLVEPQRAHVLAHERAHLARRDHWWKPLGFVLLAVHWFNPVLWLTYVLLCRDIELACDERVIRNLDRARIADYSQALLACGAARARIAACPLAFGEVGVKQRVKNVLNYRKPAFWIVCAAIVACIAAGICFLTNPASGQREDAWDKRPALYIDGVYYVDPYMPISYLPFGFSDAGSLTKAQANNTGLEGTEYYTNPEDPSCIFTYQLSGTPTGLNKVDTERLTWQYLRWVPIDTVHGATRPLTLDDVRRLAEKGEALTWDDLALFDSYDASEQWDPTESEGDPYIRVYPIEAMFELRIGGESPKTPPRYVYLRNRDINAWCEIRTRDVNAFIKAASDLNDMETIEQPDLKNLMEGYPGDPVISAENSVEEVAALLREFDETFRLDDYHVEKIDRNDGSTSIDFRRMIGAFVTDSAYVASIRPSRKLFGLGDFTKEIPEEEIDRLLALVDRLGISQMKEAEQTLSVQETEQLKEPKELAEALRLALEQAAAIPTAEPTQQRYAYYYEVESRTASILVSTDYRYDGETTAVDAYQYILD